MLTERGKALLSSLLKREEPVAVASLSQAFKVSNRTIRYDLDNIDNWLKSNVLPQLIRKPNCGVEFAHDAQARHNALLRLGRSDSRYYVLSPKERTKAIIAELLQKRDYVTIDQLAEKVSVSRSTMINDLAEVKKWLVQYDLQLVPLRRYGMRVVGDEKALRRCVVDFLNQNLTLAEALELIKPPSQNGQGKANESQLLASLDLLVIEDSVRKIESELGIVFTDVAFANLALHMALAVRRLQLGRNIDMPKVELDSLKCHSQFGVVTAVTESMSERLGVSIPEDEVGYITQHVLASSISSTETSDVPIDLQMIVCNLIGAVGRRLKQDFSADQQLFQGLTSHIGPAMQRLERQFVIKNPYLDELKAYQKDLFEAVAESAFSLLVRGGVPLPADEIGFLAMHFGAALERRLLGRVLPAVLVVCGTGLGTANLLSNKLKANFNLNIVDTVAVHQVRDLLKSVKVDLIITTIPLEAEVRTVCVTPFLTPKDMAELRAVLGERGLENLDIDSLVAIIARHCSIRDQNSLVRELTAYLGSFGAGGKRLASQPVLHLNDILAPKYISIDEPAADWEEAVVAGGRLLAKSGAVGSVYIENMVAAIKRLGPYVVIAPGIALPHASNNDGVNRVAMSCVRLKTPVAFGKPQNDPVDLLFSFSTPNKVSHQQVLQELGRLLADETAVRKLREAGNTAEFLAVFRDFAQ